MAALTPSLRGAQRIVIKIGSALLVDGQGALRDAWLKSLAEDVAMLRSGGADVILVSSGSRLRWTAFLGHERVAKFDGTFPEDKTRAMLQLNAQISPTFLLRGRLDMTRTQADLPSVAGDLAELRLTAIRSFRNGYDLRAEAWHRRDTRDGPDALFGTTRRDRINGLEFGVSDRDIRIGPFVPEMIVGTEVGASSIALYEFDNRYVNFGLRARF